MKRSTYIRIKDKKLNKKIQQLEAGITATRTPYLYCSHTKDWIKKREYYLATENSTMFVSQNTACKIVNYFAAKYFTFVKSNYYDDSFRMYMIIEPPRFKIKVNNPGFECLEYYTKDGKLLDYIYVGKSSTDYVTGLVERVTQYFKDINEA